MTKFKINKSNGLLVGAALLSSVLFTAEASAQLSPTTPAAAVGAPAESGRVEGSPQSSATTPAAPIGASTQIEEVIVTAEKHSESLQKTPIAITAITADRIEQSGISGAEQLQFSVPSLTFGANSGFNYISLRGIGSDTITTAAETSVATYVDNVYTGGLITEAIPNSDLQRIEVLRGPQGTLYGRNATGGVINYITKGPSFEPDEDLAVSYGNYNAYSVDAGLSGPIVDDKVAFRVSGHINDHDGYRYNLDTDNREDASRTGSGRAALLIKVSDSIAITLRGDVAHNQSSNPIELLSEHSLDGVTTQSTPLGLFSLPAAALAAIPGLLSPADLARLNGGSIANYFHLAQPGPLAPDPTKNLDFANSFPSRYNADSNGGSGTIDWNAGDIDVKSISAFRYSHLHFQSDNSGSSAPFTTVSPLDQISKQFTQEFNVSGHSFGDKLDWLVGGFYFHEDADVNLSVFVPATTEAAIAGISLANQTPGFPYMLNLSQPLLTQFFRVPSPLATILSPGTDPVTGEQLSAGVSVPTTGFVGYSAEQKSQSLAGFSQATFHFTDRLRVTGGFRFTDDDKQVVRSSHSNLLVALGQSSSLCDGVRAKKTWLAPTGTLGLDYDITPRILGYEKVSFGYKAGGFNPSQCSGAFNPEKLTSYETGLKSTVANGQLRLNAAAYYYDYTAIQFTTYVNNSASIMNAGSATAYGTELEYQFNPSALVGFQLDGSFSYEHSAYGNGVFQDPAFQFRNGGMNIKGNSLIRAPDLKGNLGVQYSVPIAGDGSMTVRVEEAYTSKVYNDIFNGKAPFSADTTQPAYWMSNAWLGWASRDRRWTAQLFGDNLTNEKYSFIRSESNSPSSMVNVTGQFAPPRTYGVRAAMKFGSATKR